LLFGQPYTAIDCKNSDKVLYVTPADYSNRNLLERAHCMLSNVGLSKDFWVEAINPYCYLVNHTQLLIVKILIKYCMLLSLIIRI